MGRKSIQGGVSALGSDRIQFDFEFDGVRYRPTLKRSATEANLSARASSSRRSNSASPPAPSSFAEEFPDYRFIRNVAAPQKRRTCDQVFDEFLLACDSRVAKKDLAFVTAQGYPSSLRKSGDPRSDRGFSMRSGTPSSPRSPTPTNGRRKPTTMRSAWFAAPSTTATGITRRSTTRPPVSIVCE